MATSCLVSYSGHDTQKNYCERKTPGINQACSRENRLQYKDSGEFSRFGLI